MDTILHSIGTITKEGVAGIAEKALEHGKKRSAVEEAHKRLADINVFLVDHWNDDESIGDGAKKATSP